MKKEIYHLQGANRPIPLTMEELRVKVKEFLIRDQQHKWVKIDEFWLSTCESNPAAGLIFSHYGVDPNNLIACSFYDKYGRMQEGYLFCWEWDKSMNKIIATIQIIDLTGIITDGYFAYGVNIKKLYFNEPGNDLLIPPKPQL